MRSRCLLAAAATIAISCALAGPARAQVSGNFSVNHFNPSERGSDWFFLDSLALRGSVRPAIGIVGDWATRPLVVYNGDGSLQASVVRNQATLHAGASVVLWDRLRVALDIPIQVYANGRRGELGGGTIILPPAHATTLGDLRFSADVRLFGTYGDIVTAAAGASLWLPSGDPASYSGDPGVRFAPHVLVSGDVGMFVYAGSAGVMYRDTKGFGDSSVGTEITLGASAGVRLLDRKLVVGPELFGDTVVSTSDSTLTKRATPLEGLLGAHYLIADAIRVGAGVSTGLAHGYGAPTFRGILSAEWAPVPRKAEPAPSSAPAISEPADRDNDGIVDARDACPDIPGPRSEAAAKNGCPPPPDADGDGVADAADACPALAGRAADDPKANGCPVALDGDKDGVVDAEDACPTVPGLKSADLKINGCPDPDRDKDGIANESDACPDDAGNTDLDPKRNGCPKAFVKDGQIKIADQVKFGLKSALILPGKDSQDVLQAVASILKQHPEIKGLRIEGYSDSVGSVAQNESLSQQRAASVLRWLVAHGIDMKTLQSVGLGPEKPIDTNETAAGRANNRRVEFHILDAAPSAAAEREKKP